MQMLSVELKSIESTFRVILIMYCDDEDVRRKEEKKRRMSISYVHVNTR